MILKLNVNGHPSMVGAAISVAYRKLEDISNMLCRCDAANSTEDDLEIEMTIFKTRDVFIPSLASDRCRYVCLEVEQGFVVVIGCGPPGALANAAA